MTVPEHLIEAGAEAVELVGLRKAGLADWLAGQPETVRGWVGSVGFGSGRSKVMIVSQPSGC